MPHPKISIKNAAVNTSMISPDFYKILDCFIRYADEDAILRQGDHPRM